MNEISTNATGYQLKDIAISLIEEYVKILHEMGFTNVVGTNGKYDLIKNNLDDDGLNRLIAHLKPAILTIQNIEKEVDIDTYTQNELFYLKRFMFLNKLQTQYNLDEIIDRFNVIEVYDSNNIQMYRSFNFFKICSYSFEEIFSNQWWDLFERNAFLSKKIASEGMKLIVEQIKEIKHINCPPHWVSEKNSKQKLACYQKQDLLIPLTNEKGIVSAVMAPLNILKFRDQNGEETIIRKEMAH